MKLKTVYLVLKTSKPVVEEASRLRGYIGNMFVEYPILHHHAPSPIYTYPKVQYKIIGGTPSILGIEEGAFILKKVSDSIDRLELGKRKYKVEQKIIYEQITEIKETRTKIQYRFLTPWLAFNQSNYNKFMNLKNWKERKGLLNSILIGNILSMSKGLGLVVEKEISASTKVDGTKTVYKGIDMIGFTGEFRVNFKIPDFFGIGKGVSQGFGSVKMVDGETF